MELVKLDKRKMRGSNIVGYLHGLAHTHFKVDSVSEVSWSMKTEKHFEKVLKQLVAREYDYLPKKRQQLMVAMEILQTSFSVNNKVPDFHIAKREK